MFGQGLQDLTSEDIRIPSTNLDLAIHLFAEGNTLRGYIMYQSDLFAPETVSSFLNIFQRVVSQVMLTPAVNIASMDLFTAWDLERLWAWNDTNLSAPIPGSLVDGFRASVTAHPDDIALVDGSISLTYAEVDAKTDCLASWLLSKGFNREAAIGIVSTFSAESLCVFLI